MNKVFVGIALLLACCLSLAQEAFWAVRDGRPIASVVVAADAGEEEKRGAADLLKYVEMMTGARLPLAVLEAGRPLPSGPAIVLGKAALAADASLQRRLAAVAKKNPLVNADAIVLRRAGDRLYVAGNSDLAHYFAVSKLLQDWGC